MTRIGKYEIEAELGRGGFGRVFRAYDPVVGRQVAIKILTAEGDKSLSTRFRNEAAAAGKLRHKNIVTVYDFGEYKGTPFLVMEYLEGEDLHCAMNRPGGLTLLQKVSIMSQAAEGLHCAHENGVIHRDVKPANIMVLKDGTAKIMDFGIARIVREDATRLTRKGDLIGTMLYMSPEQFTSSEVDALCDVFAYGVIYYELLTGKHPFRAPDAAAMMYKITVEDPEPVRRLAPECPQELEDMVHRAIQKDRDLRYQSMREIQLDSEPILIGLQQERAAELIASAQALFEKRELDAAREMVLEGLDLDPANRTGRQLREALQKALQRVTLQPRLDALLTRAGEDLEARRFADAIQNLEAALRLDRANTAVAGRLEEARAALERSRKSARLLAEARKEYQRGDLEASRNRVAEALREDAGNPEAQAILQRLEEEIRTREEARRLKEGLARASSLLAIHSFDDALAALERLVSEHPRSEEAARLLERARAEKAESERRRRLRMELASAADLLREQRFEEAAQALEAIGREFPGEQEVADLMGYARRELQAQRRAEAVRVLNREVAECLARHDFAGAFALVEEALKSYPGESGAVRLLRSVKTAQAEWERRQAIDAAVRRSEELAAALRFAEALEGLEAAARLYGSEAVAEQRARVEEQWARHRREEAIRADLEKARALFNRGEFERAAAAARASLATYPDDARLAALVNEAEAAEQARREAIARLAAEARALAGAKEFDRALQSIEGREELSDVRGEILAARAAWEREQAIEAACREAREAMETGALARAADRLRRAGAEFGNEPRLASLLQETVGRIADAAREFAAAKEFGRALEVLEGHEELAALRGETMAARAAWEREQAIDAVAREARAALERGDPEDALARLRATEYRGDGRLIALAEEAERALRTRQKEIAEAERDARRLLGARSFDEALATVGRVRAKYPAQSSLEALEGEIHSAREAFEREREIAAVCEEARALAAVREYEKAVAALRAGAGRFPGERRIAALLADAERELETQRRNAAIAGVLEESAALKEAREFDFALKALDAGLKAWPGEPALREARAVALREKVAWERERAIGEVASRARKAIGEGRFLDAAALLSESLSRYPDARELRALLAEAEEKQRHAEAAAALCEEAVKLCAAKQFDRALALLKEGLARHPGHAAAVLAQTEAIDEVAGLFAREEYLRAAEVCRARLRADPHHAFFTRMEAEAGERHAQKAEPFLAALDARLAAEPDLGRRIEILRDGLRQYPGESRLEVELRFREARRELVQSILQKARAHEEAGEYDEALEQWSALASAYRQYPGLEEQIRRVRALRDRGRADAEAHWIRQIEQAIESNAFANAEGLLRMAREEFSGDAWLEALERKLKARAEAARMLADAERLCSQRRYEEACQLFGLAHKAEDASPAFRAHVLETLARQASKAGTDWRSAELLVKHARGLDPRWAVPPALKAAIDEGRRAEGEAVAVAEATATAPPPTVLERLPPPPPPAPTRRRLPMLAVAVGVAAAAAAFFAWRSWRAEPMLVMEVRTVPDGVSVWLGEKSCTTPNCRFDIAPGEHRITLSKPGYESAVRTVVADAGKPKLLRNVRVELVPLPQTLQISSNLSSGTVWLDGRQAGRLQDGQMAVAALTSGTHELKVSGPDGEMEMSFRTSAGEPPQVSAGPRAKDLKALIAAEFARNVRVYCNCEGARVSAGGGDPVAVSAAGAQIGKLPEGVHELRVMESDGTRTVVLPVRASPSMNVFLTADRNVGTLVVEAGEPGARVLLDGRYRATAADGVLRVQVEPGAYEVKVEKQGYQPAAPRRVEVRKGEETRAPFRLMPVPQVARLAVTGASPGTQIRLDGKPLGVVGRHFGSVWYPRWQRPR